MKNERFWYVIEDGYLHDPHGQDTAVIKKFQEYYKIWGPFATHEEALIAKHNMNINLGGLYSTTERDKDRALDEFKRRERDEGYVELEGAPTYEYYSFQDNLQRQFRLACNATGFIERMKKINPEFPEPREWPRFKEVAPGGSRSGIKKWRTKDEPQ